jgi:hypothetical protein
MEVGLSKMGVNEASQPPSARPLGSDCNLAAGFSVLSGDE